MAHLTTSPLPFAFFEGNVVPIEQAKVSIMTNALQYGTGIFGGVRAYYNSEGKFMSIFRIDDHFKRFVQSFHIIGVSLKYSQEDLVRITKELLTKNAPTVDTYIRPFGYAASLNLAPNLQRDNVFEFAEYMMPLGEYLPVDKGISVMVSSWRRIADNAIPSRAKISGSYINSALAKQEANQHGHDEAIFLNEAGHVAEGSAMNLFIVRDGVLITPGKTDDILEGITRRTIMEVARDKGIPVEERTVDRSELYVSDEAFFSGTGAQISWIAKIDNRIIGNGNRGAITKDLQETFFRIVRGQEEKYESWCTKISVA